MPTSPRSKFHPIRNKFQQIRNSFHRADVGIGPYRRGNQPTGDCHGKRSLPRNDRWGRLEQPSSTEIAGLPFRSIHRGRAVAKIAAFLGRGNEYCTYNSARLEGSGEVALIAGAINSNPPQPASLVSFLPEQERYPPEELHWQIPQRVSFSTQMLAITTVIARGRIATPVCGLARNDRGIRWIQQPTNRRLPRHFVARNDRGFRWILQPTDREEQPLT